MGFEIAPKSLVDENDRHRDNDSRFYLYVSPSPKVTARNKDLTPPNVPLLDMGGHLMTAVIGQAQYQDISALLKTNRRVAAFDATAQRLATLLAGNAAFAATFAQTAPVLAQAAFANLSAGEESLTDAITRLLGEYENETWFQNALPPGPMRTAWAQLLAAFERTATLQTKDTMTLLTICATTDELLGDPISAFGGFTTQEVRHHDYEVGRSKTQLWLSSPNNPLGLDLTGYVFEPTNLAADRLKATTALQANAQASGDYLGSRVAYHIKLLLDEFDVGWPVKNVIASGINKLTSAYVTKKLKAEADSPPPPII